MTAVLLSYLIIGLFLNQKVSQVCTPLDQEFRAINRRLLERIERIQRVKTCAKEEEEAKDIELRLRDLISRDRKFWIWFSMAIIHRGYINILALTAILGYGIASVSSGVMEIGSLFPLMVWAGTVSDNLWRFQHVEKQLNECLPGVTSLRRALLLPRSVMEKQKAIHLDPCESVTIEFSSVGHTYTEEQLEEEGKKKNGGVVPVLRNVSWIILPGQKVALIGSSGAGKTTIMRLLLRFMDPEQGSVKINGHDLRDLDLSSWLEIVGYVPQQAEVFDGTFRDNLLYALSEEDRIKITEEQLWSLVRQVQLDLGKRLTNGLKTRVGRSGLQLSGGQAQRLMVAAAMAKSLVGKLRFVIVDEATSSLDSTTEQAVQRGIEQMLSSSGIGALVIAHRLSTLRFCDRFIVLRPAEGVLNDDNQVEAVASSFEELYRISPTFRRLADDQGLVIL